MAVRTPIEAGVIARVVAGVRYAVSGAVPDGWFSPLTPINPVVPANQLEGVEGRALDYPVGYNTRTTPRQGEPVTFAQMRALADGYDLLRLIIETRKDQMAKLKWKFKPIEDGAPTDSRCETLNQFFRFPDKENSWDDWLRMLLEEMFVTDAASIYVRPTLGGQPYGFELVDGSTVSRKLDIRGRTPLPPETAYQQVLKGVPAVNYSTDELIYAPRNKRVHRIYGYSPVEQVIMTVNIALRRQIHQLQYYTEGSTPDLVFSVPSDWNPDQTRRFKAAWDDVLQGNTGARRGTMFIPDGVHVINTKADALKDDYDEWLSKIICYAFSVSSQAFSRQMNRATAQTSVEQSELEGLSPIKLWVKGVMDRILSQHLGVTDLEFDWVDEESIDPLIQAQVNQIYIVTAVKTPDEVRVELGMDALSPDEREQAFPTPPAPIDPLSPEGQAALFAKPVKPNDNAGKFEIHNHIAPPDVIVDIGKTTINVNSESAEVDRNTIY